VMAVPGSPLDPRAQGCNQLIRDGATLIQTPADVLESISNLNGKVAGPVQCFDAQPSSRPIETEPVSCSEIEDLLGPSPVPVDEVVRLSGRGPSEVQLALLELDLAGRLDRHAGNRVSLR
jgi:DNA processing protein